MHLLPMLVRRGVQLDEELDGLGRVLYTSLGAPLFLNIYLCLEVASFCLYFDQGFKVAFGALDRVFWRLLDLIQVLEVDRKCAKDWLIELQLN